MKDVSVRSDVLQVCSCYWGTNGGDPYVECHY